MLVYGTLTNAQGQSGLPLTVPVAMDTLAAVRLISSTAKEGGEPVPSSLFIH